jgi:N-acetylglucosamine kinase-like BadF-type ATPase
MIAPRGCFIGIDGGGTKTTAKVLCQDFPAPAVFIGGSANICGADRAAVKQNLRELFSRFKEYLGGREIEAICIGAAGMSNPEARGFLDGILAEFAPGARRVIASDAEIALCGALMRTTGTVVIAGTGSICVGRLADGMAVRAGGCGHLIDDEGSAYAIGRDLFRAVVRAYDGRGPETALSKLLAGQFGLDSVEKIIHYVYDSPGKEAVAAAAPLVSQACLGGDAVAREIAGRAATELFMLAAPVLRHAELARGKIALLGGVLTGDARIREDLRNRLREAYPLLEAVDPIGSAADGALMLLNDGAAGRI